MELVIVSLIGMVIVAAMITLVVVQVRVRNNYWNIRKDLADQMLERDAVYYASHGINVETLKH